MMFVGFGFLMTFLKKYGYSAVGFNFILAAFVLEWSLLVEGWIEMIKTENESHFTFSVHSLLVSDFTSASVLIAFGAVIGKATLSQLLVMGFFQVVFQRFNEYVCVNYLKVIFFIKKNIEFKKFLYKIPFQFSYFIRILVKLLYIDTIILNDKWNKIKLQCYDLNLELNILLLLLFVYLICMYILKILARLPLHQYQSLYKLSTIYHGLYVYMSWFI